MKQFECLMRLADASQSLCVALKERDPDLIMKAVACQDDMLRALQLSEKEPSVAGEQRSKIIELVARIKKIQRINKVIADSFLRLIDGTLMSLGTGDRAGKSMYCSSGGVDMSVSPILVHQSG